MGDDKKVVVPAKYSDSDVANALALLEKTKEQKAKFKAKMQDPAYQSKMKAAFAKKRAAERIILAKAAKAGLSATEDEIAAYLAAQPVKRGKLSDFVG